MPNTAAPTSDPSSEKKDIGPKEIATASTTNGPQFAMAATEWITLQTYVTDGLALPTTEAEFGKSLGPGAPGDLSTFGDLVAAYGKIHQHCEKWQSDTYPKTVTLASRVVEYGKNKAPVYYPPIQKEADILTANPDDEHAKAALAAILGSLAKTARDFANEAGAVKKEIQAFYDDTKADHTILVGTDGQGGLVKAYNDEYGTSSQDVQDLLKELDDQRRTLEKANEDYNYDVTVAATTPTYAWIFPFGTIAAGVVAGVYGKRATDALKQAQAAQAKINDLQEKLQADYNLLTYLKLAENGLGRIVGAMDAALPIIAKVEGVWGGIADDLSNIITIVQNDIGQALPIIMNLGIDEAVTAWHNVARAADAYRVNAYVQPVAGAPSMAAVRVDRLVASRPSLSLSA